jgi:hypothetical protein
VSVGERELTTLGLLMIAVQVPNIAARGKPRKRQEFLHAQARRTLLEAFPPSSDISAINAKESGQGSQWVVVKLDFSGRA